MPGSPKTGRAPSEPNVIGLPGRHRDLPEMQLGPARVNASRTRSSSPTDTPAEERTTSASLARRTRSSMASRRSGATPSCRLAAGLAALPPSASTCWCGSAGPAGAPGPRARCPSLEAIEERVRRAKDADVGPLLGGVSVGELDLVREAFTRAGAELLFWKVSMRPGKPITFGSLGRGRSSGCRAIPSRRWSRSSSSSGRPSSRCRARARLTRPHVRARALEAIPNPGVRRGYLRVELETSAEGTLGRAAEPASRARRSCAPWWPPTGSRDSAGHHGGAW